MKRFFIARKRSRVSGFLLPQTLPTQKKPIYCLFLYKLFYMNFSSKQSDIYEIKNSPSDNTVLYNKPVILQWILLSKHRLSTSVTICLYSGYTLPSHFIRNTCAFVLLSNPMHKIFQIQVSVNIHTNARCCLSTEDSTGYLVLFL